MGLSVACIGSEGVRSGEAVGGGPLAEAPEECDREVLAEELDDAEGDLEGAGAVPLAQGEGVDDREGLPLALERAEALGDKVCAMLPLALPVPECVTVAAGDWEGELLALRDMEVDRVPHSLALPPGLTVALREAAEHAEERADAEMVALEHGEGDSVAEALAHGEALGERVGDSVGEFVPQADGEAVAVSQSEGVTLADWDAEPHSDELLDAVREGVALSDTVGKALAEGCAAREGPSSTVRGGIRRRLRGHYRRATGDATSLGGRHGKTSGTARRVGIRAAAASRGAPRVSKR